MENVDKQVLDSAVDQTYNTVQDNSVVTTKQIEDRLENNIAEESDADATDHSKSSFAGVTNDFVSNCEGGSSLECSTMDNYLERDDSRSEQLPPMEVEQTDPDQPLRDYADDKTLSDMESEALPVENESLEMEHDTGSNDADSSKIDGDNSSKNMEDSSMKDVDISTVDTSQEETFTYQADSSSQEPDLVLPHESRVDPCEHQDVSLDIEPISSEPTGEQAEEEDGEEENRRDQGSSGVGSPADDNEKPSSIEPLESGDVNHAETDSTVDNAITAVEDKQSSEQSDTVAEVDSIANGSMDKQVTEASIGSTSTTGTVNTISLVSTGSTVSVEDTSTSTITESINVGTPGQENTEFVQVNTESEISEQDKDPEKEDLEKNVIEHDPIASDGLEAIANDDREGADEELCIIPDTQREISQAEKDAAATIPPLRDLSAASTSDQTDSGAEATIQSSEKSIVVLKYSKEDLQMCNGCKLKRKAMYYYTNDAATLFICDDSCLSHLKENSEEKVICNWEEGGLRVKNFTGSIKEPPLAFIRKCASCGKITKDIENNLTWEIMDFCNEFCLTKYQKEIGSHCSSCQGEVKSNSLGKYCVRFGNDIRQFCTSICLEKYKKGLKVCSYCQQDMSGGPTGFLAPVGDKGQFKDFCSQLCMEKYDIMTNDRPPNVEFGTLCSVCKTEKPITIEFELKGTPNYFCGEPCFVAFRFVNNISSGKCAMCKRYFPKEILEKYTMYYDNVQHSFCSNSCENIYIIAHRKIVPCSWCKVKKYNFDMIRRYSKSGPMINMCSVNCLGLYRVSLDTAATNKNACNFCQKLSPPTYHLTMTDGSIRNFCTYNCVMSYQNQFPKQPMSITGVNEPGFPVPTGGPKRSKRFSSSADGGEHTTIPVISNVQSLASCTNGSLVSATTIPALTTINTRSTRSKSSTASTPVTNANFNAELPVQVQIKQHFIVRPAPVPEQRNVATMCYTRKANKGTTIKPVMVDQEVQTEEREAKKILIPVPVPVYVPAPMHMFGAPVPVPVPIPVPIPIPIFVPTTRNSAQGIMKEIKKIQVKIPTDPYEAELLMMAEMVAEEKKEDITDSESDVDDAGPDDGYSPEPVEASNTFGDDMLQMALKMATELEEPAVDLEGALTANTITAQQGGEGHGGPEEGVDDHQQLHQHMIDRNAVRGRKRGIRQQRGGPVKRGRRMSHVDMPMMQQQPPPQPEPVEKPDANMCLKYTFGVNAWKQWVTTKNAELEKSSRRCKLFKTEILQLTSDELSYSLCLFVKEVRKPNGAEYAPDTIYYLCLGIQQYLFENGRIDNIFCDPYYEKFTDCLDEIAKKFSVLYNDSHYIVTRVEEEHLWESKQLGAHSPHVLLSTLMFFNTKHFNLTTVEEHMQLSFSHIMKHWKRNPNQPGASSKIAGTRNVLLRFYPPQSAIQNNARKKKVYEQQENEENPLRCPVKLYEFYLSKCPESVRTRNDVFYLQPERSCVPDSPVWYSTMPLPKAALEKMLHRVKMVKEINVALLTS